jgi:hypothetical protein
MIALPPGPRSSVTRGALSRSVAWRHRGGRARPDVAEMPRFRLNLVHGQAEI